MCFVFLEGPVSCFRSAAGTKLEMGCDLAAHPGKQRRPVCLCSAPQLPSRPQRPGAALTTALGADGREREGSQPPKGSCSSHPAPSGPGAATAVLPRAMRDPCPMPGWGSPSPCRCSGQWQRAQGHSQHPGGCSRGTSSRVKLLPRGGTLPPPHLPGHHAGRTVTARVC